MISVTLDSPQIERNTKREIQCPLVYPTVIRSHQEAESASN